MSLAALPMYDLPQLRRYTDAWWAGLARAFEAEGIKEVPARLERSLPEAEIWTAPDLLLAQLCGYSLLHGAAERLSLVAAPCYAAPGAGEGRYCSLIVVPEASPAASIAELRGGVAAFNEAQSHSGMNALRHVVAPHARSGRFFSRVRESGSHLASLACLRLGQADVAAVDCVTYALLARHVPDAVAGTRVLMRTAEAPALPYVSRGDASADLLQRLRAGLARAATDSDLAETREALLLEGFVVTSLADYRPITAIAEAAVLAGYPELG